MSGNQINDREMRRSILFLMAAVVLAATSCTKESDVKIDSEKELVTMSFDATIGNPTKTELGESNGAGGYKVLWSKGDRITVVANDESAESGYDNGVEFTTDIASANISATFTGQIVEGDSYYALYPYDASHRWYYESDKFSAKFNVNQVAGNLSNGLAVAKVVDGKLDFKHVCGYIKFEIPVEVTDVCRVSFKGNADETIGGKYIYVDMAASPMHSVSSGGVNTLALTPASGDVFTPGIYYIAVLPTDLESGFTLTFTTSDDKVAEKSTDKSASIQAGHILNLGEMTGLEFVKVTTCELPWSEDCSAADVLSNYISQGVEIANENVAGGVSPEFFLKGTASLTALVNVAGKDRNLTLTYKTNKYNKSDLALNVSSDDGNVVLSEKSYSADNKMVLYNLTLDADVDDVKLTWSSTANSRLDDINLFEGTKALQTISFSAITATATIGQDFDEPELTGAKTTVTYTSSNPEVATVNSEGKVAILKAGTTIIRADAVETDGYLGAEASYELTVVEAGVYNYVFTDKSWGDATNSWICGVEGAGYSNNGIQVSTKVGTAKATCKSELEKVKKVVVTYCTNKSSGAGSVKVSVGSVDKEGEVGYSGPGDGRYADYTLELDFSGELPTGCPAIEVKCTTNSVYVKGVTITVD